MPAGRSEAVPNAATEREEEEGCCSEYGETRPLPLSHHHCLSYH